MRSPFVKEVICVLGDPYLLILYSLLCSCFSMLAMLACSETITYDVWSNNKAFEQTTWGCLGNFSIERSRESHIGQTNISATLTSACTLHIYICIFATTSLIENELEQYRITLLWLSPWLP